MKINSRAADADVIDKQRGFTLIEALVVMIVGIVILAAAAAGIGKLFRTSEISTEASNVTQIATNLRNIATNGRGLEGLDNELAAKLNVFPKNMTQGPDSAVLNSWGGKVNLGLATDKHAFIDYYDVPAEACQQLVVKFLPSGAWYRIQLNDKPIARGSSLAEIAKGCNGDNNKNKVAFVI